MFSKIFGKREPAKKLRATVICEFTMEEPGMAGDTRYYRVKRGATGIATVCKKGIHHSIKLDRQYGESYHHYPKIYCQPGQMYFGHFKFEPIENTGG